MSGIAGMMNLRGEPPSAEALLAMGAALRHRGPDGESRYRIGDVAVIELRHAPAAGAAGGAPQVESGAIALFADGAIADDAALPAGAASASELYRRHGAAFAGRLRGAFALVLHDPVAGRLVLARDPFGLKPLYYAETPAGFAFASEPGALLAAGCVPAQLARQVRNELLQVQFTTGRETIFAGIQRLLPGETVVVARGRVVERHQRAALPEGAPAPIEERAALARLDDLLVESVGLSMRGAAPCGVFLPGGIDGAAVLATMARLGSLPAAAFTPALATGPTNPLLAEEREQARCVAAAVGVPHVIVEFGEVDLWRLLPEIVAAIDDPTADYAILPTYKLASAARESGIRVVLSGEGGDELFAGYGRYRAVMRPWWAGGKLARSRGILDGLGVLRGDLAGWRDGIAAAEFRVASAGRTRLQVAQATDVADWLPNDVLAKLDRCLMAHGVESRAPFLDPSIAEFAFRLPDELKLRKGLGKWLLRRWIGERLPEAPAFARRSSHAVPVTEWLARRGTQLGPLVAGQPGIREICLPESVETLFAHIKGKRQGFAAWSLLFYALWHRHHILRLPPAPDVFAALAATH